MYTLWSSAVLYVVLTTISGSIRKLFQATSFQTTFAKNMTMMSMAGSGNALLGARQLNGKTESSQGRRKQGWGQGGQWLLLLPEPEFGWVISSLDLNRNIEAKP